jgi:hypothetical protein
MSETYGLSRDYEYLVALMCCTKPRFFGRVGHAVDPNMLKDPGAQILVKASQAIGKDLGHGPSDARTVFQRIARWMDDGQVTEDQRNLAYDVVMEGPQSYPPEEEVIVEIAAVLKRKMEAQVVRTAMDEYAHKGDFKSVVKMLTKANNLGKTDTSVGEKLGVGSFAEIDRLRNVDRLPVGIAEIDARLDGGMPRGSEGLIVAGTGGGKSMFMTHVLASALRLGLFAVLATLELPKGVQLARLKANLTGVPISKITMGTAADREMAVSRLEKMYPVLGQCIVQYFPARTTTIIDIMEWVKRCEEVENQKVDLVVIDYIDKLKSHDSNDKNSYSEGGTIAETFHNWLEETGKWGFTASQPQRRAGKEKNRRIEADELADSQQKARVADFVLTATRNEDQMTYFAAKYRHGESEWTVGPLPHDWCNGRQVHMADEDFDEPSCA